jgi:glycosyltransferase involved in cell wall biosynthesis
MKLESLNRRRNRIILTGGVPPPYHGANIYFQWLLDSKITQEFEVVHLDTSDHRNLDNLGTLDVVNVYLAIKNLLQLMRYCFSEKPALGYLPISANNLGFFRDGLFIIVLGLLSDAKVVIHLHAGEYFRTFAENTNRFMRWFITITLKRVDTAIVLGNRLKRIFDGLVSHVEVVPNGIPCAPLVHTSGAKKKGEELRVGYLGNLIKSKGVLDLLVAARAVIRKYPKARFRFAGAWWQQEPETKEQALRFIHENGLDGSVEFAGVVLNGDKEDFLTESDIFVFPSWYEGLPLVILEAMTKGCPVISTRDVGAIPEVVVDGVTGILVEKQNPQQLSQAIIKLIENPELRESMAKAGRRRFEEYYTLDHNVNRVIQVFETVLDRKE